MTKTKEQIHAEQIEACRNIWKLNYAKSDITIARRNKVMAITGLKVGNVEVRYLGRNHYMIVDFNNQGYAHYVGGQQGAIKWLAQQYQVKYE